MDASPVADGGGDALMSPLAATAAHLSVSGAVDTPPPATAAGATSADVDAAVQLGRSVMADFLRSTRAYDVCAESSKVVVFDIDVPLRLAFYALVEHDAACAPLWDSVRGHFAGCLTVSDLCDIMRIFHVPGTQAAAAALQDFTIAAWRQFVASGEGLRRGLSSPELRHGAAVGAAATTAVAGAAGHSGGGGGAADAGSAATLVGGASAVELPATPAGSLLSTSGISVGAASGGGGTSDAALAAAGVGSSATAASASGGVADEGDISMGRAPLASSSTAGGGGDAGGGSAAAGSVGVAAAGPADTATSSAAARGASGVAASSSTTPVASAAGVPTTPGLAADAAGGGGAAALGRSLSSLPPPRASASGGQHVPNRVLPRLVSIHPEENLLQVAVKLRRYGIHHMPVVDPVSHTVVAVLSYRALLRHVIAKFADARPELFDAPLISLGIGSYAPDLVAVPETASLVSVLQVLAERRISSVPIVTADEYATVVDTYSREDVAFLAVDPTLLVLDAPVGAVRKTQTSMTGIDSSLMTCRATDTLGHALTLLAVGGGRVERLVCVDDARRVTGVVSLSDIFGYFTRGHEVEAL